MPNVVRAYIASVAMMAGAMASLIGPGSVFAQAMSVTTSTGGAAATTGGAEASGVGGLVRAGDATTGPAAAMSGMSGGANSSQSRAVGNQAGQVGSGAQAQNVRAELGGAPALGETQFQKFVQESTGKRLALYGYNLFDRSRFPSINEVPVPANYVVGPGDEIDIKIWGSTDIGLRLPVDRQGRITIPKVGPISVTGVRANELDAYLKKQIAKVFNNFELSATVGKLRSIQIFVVGQARNPGAYTVSSLSSLVSAIFESGGPAATGTMRKIDLMRSGAKIASIDLYKFMQAGDASADTRLLPGDVIVIPPAGPRVALTGALDNPYIFELANEQETVAQILTYSASSTVLTTPFKMLVERVDNQKSKGPREIQERVLDAAGLKSTVRDGDILTLFNISPQFANAVTLRGNVASPLRYSYKPGMKVSDLIPETDALILGDYYARKNILVQYESGRGISADRAIGEARGSLSEINWEYASIERMNSKEVTSNLITFQLGKAIKQKDPAHNIELLPGDVVTIFGVNDIPVPKEKRTQFVKIGGEVKAPGIYQIKPSDTLPAIIQRAGGLASDAYLYGTVFTRESTRQQQQANLDQAIRKLEAQITAQTSTALQNVSSSETGQNLQAQLAVQRLSLDRLKSLRASGRIALEL